MALDGQKFQEHEHYTIITG